MNINTFNKSSVVEKEAESILLFLFVEFNCETSIYRSCGKLAEGPEKSHGNDEELGRWNSTMYPGEVSSILK
eukprot:bmy_04024T0